MKLTFGSFVTDTVVLALAELRKISYTVVMSVTVGCCDETPGGKFVLATLLPDLD